MLVTEELRKMTQSQPPVLTVYLNTLSPDYGRHPTVPPAAAWFRKAASTLSRTLLPRDVKHFLREAQKVQEFLEARGRSCRSPRSAFFPIHLRRFHRTRREEV